MAEHQATNSAKDPFTIDSETSGTLDDGHQSINCLMFVEYIFAVCLILSVLIHEAQT